MSASAKKARRGYKLTPCGEIPQDWECVALGSIFAERIETGFTDLPLLAVTGERGIVLRDSLARRDSSSEDKSAYLRVCPGDIAYNTMRMWQGVSGLSPYEGIVSPAYTICRPLDGLVPEFAPYLLKHPANIRLFHRHSQGLVDDTLNLKFPHFARLQVALPGAAEQKRMARILADADAAISSAQRALDQHRNLKFLALCRLVERGTSPKPKLGKRVGVTSWRFPAMWALAPLSEVADVSSGVTLGRQLSGDDVVELPYLRVANVQDGHLDISELKTVQVRRSELPRFLLQSGDVLMNEGGDFDKLGRGAVWRDEVPECLHQNHVFKVRANRTLLLPEFLAVVCESAYGKHFFRSNAKQTTNLASINSSQLKEFIIPLPSIDEQRRIVEHLDHWTAAIAAEERKLAALERVKTELARRLLTGELRVKP